MDLTEAKAQARITAFARRKEAFAAGDRLAGAKRLAEVIDAHAGRTLSGYMPMRTEIDPLPAMARHGGRVCVPVVPGRGVPLRFREWTAGVPMVAGEYGALVPESGDWFEPEVLVVPLLAFDRRGFRLGYGGGYYDRTLELLRARRPTFAIGFAWAAQEVPAVPVEPVDQPLDLIVTEAEVILPT